MNEINKKCVDFRKKTPTRVISKETKFQVWKRDRLCVICKKEEIFEVHHCWYGGQKQLDEGRNGADRLVGLCQSCHNQLHFEGGNDYRQICLDYLTTIYAK